MTLAKHVAYLTTIVALSAGVAWLGFAAWDKYQENQQYHARTVEVIDQTHGLGDVTILVANRHLWPKTVREGWHKYVLLEKEILAEASLAVDAEWAEICDPQDPVCRIVRLAQERDALLRWLRAMHQAGEE